MRYKPNKPTALQNRINNLAQYQGHAPAFKTAEELVDDHIKNIKADLHPALAELLDINERLPDEQMWMLNDKIFRRFLDGHSLEDVSNKYPNVNVKRLKWLRHKAKEYLCERPIDVEKNLKRELDDWIKQFIGENK
ncbi:hypothetical protein [Endozoicomonas sp. ALB032]|uniref:hypothetical protein n=1 Tax=Endozoicomonas sp. ALB032 TaxID=3403082 RepID=UPI003BB7033A